MLSIARVENVTLWLTLGPGPGGKLKGNFMVSGEGVKMAASPLVNICPLLKLSAARAGSGAGFEPPSAEVPFSTALATGAASFWVSLITPGVPFVAGIPLVPEAPFDAGAGSAALNSALPTVGSVRGINLTAPVIRVSAV